MTLKVKVKSIAIVSFCASLLFACSDESTSQNLDLENQEETNQDSQAASAQTQIAFAKSEFSTITVTSEPNSNDVVAELTNPRRANEGENQPLTPLVLTVVEDTKDGWLKVNLPIRPNGTTGWVKKEEFELKTTSYKIEINRENHTLTLLRNGNTVKETPVAIGTGSTPTPVGDFYIVELLKPPSSDSPYGPYAYGLSGFSEELQSFAGGDGIIGIHGTNDPSSIGQDVSHGCVRVPNEVIANWAEELGLPLGTPVSIV